MATWPFFNCFAADCSGLIFLDRLRIDEVGDVDEHCLRGNLLAAHFFFQRVRRFVDLRGKLEPCSSARARGMP